MINDLDEALRQLLIKEMPIKNGEIDVAFDQPKREWSARLNRPTLNLFLFDMHENKKLRQTHPVWEFERNGNNTVTKRRRPVRVDLRYMITAWAAEPEDEHRLLTRAMLAFFRYPHLPDELLPENMQNQKPPISVVVTQKEDLGNPADFWSAMDNELRPAIPCVVTLMLDPYQPITGPLVRTRELRIGESSNPPSQKFNETTEPDQFWSIGGKINSDKPFETMQLTLVERGLEVPIQPEGRFVIGNLEAGNYTLEVSVENKKPKQHKITVPAPDYELKV